MADARLRYVLLAALALVLVTGSIAAAVTLTGRSGDGSRLRGEPASSTAGPTGPTGPTGATTPPASTAPGSAAATAAGTVSPRPSVPATPSTTVTVLPAGSLKGKVIVVDPGHNGGNASHPSTINRLVDAGNGVRKACNTTGTASNAGYSEHAYTWDVAVRLVTELRRRGATVVVTRKDDRGVGPCIDARAAVANRARATLLVSIHADGNLSRSARGFHVIRSTSMTGGSAVVARSERLALAVRSAFRSGTGMPYSTYIGGGTALSPRRDIGTLNLSTVPGVMVETGNMRNPTDIALLGSASFRARAARALADGIQAYLAAS
jgi:N-acetylmuramoyl-L-alanine amidase